MRWALAEPGDAGVAEGGAGVEAAGDGASDERPALLGQQPEHPGQPHIKSPSHQYLISEVIAEPRPNTLFPDTDLRCLTLQQVHRHMPNHTHIMGPIASTNPTLVFPERDSNRLQPILDSPVPTSCRNVNSSTRNIMSSLALRDRLHHPDGQSAPFLHPTQPIQIGRQKIAPPTHHTLIRCLFILNLRPGSDSP